MHLLMRLIAILTALSFVGSSTLSAMPLVWCIGSDGHRAVETMLHNHGTQVAEPSADEAIDAIADPSDQDPCSDWQLLSAAGAPQAKGLAVEPKLLTVVLAYPPLKLVLGASSLSHGQGQFDPSQRPAVHLEARRSVVLLI
jgi:hypothetical protein